MSALFEKMYYVGKGVIARIREIDTNLYEIEVLIKGEDKKFHGDHMISGLSFEMAIDYLESQREAFAAAELKTLKPEEIH